MFGLVKPYYKNMIKEDKCEYKCYYCGLCMGMGRNTGFISRLFINYDVCLAYLVADSISLNTEIKNGRCPFSLNKQVAYRDNPDLLNKMASINYILTYHKIIDDINDDNSIIARFVELLMRKKYNSIQDANLKVIQSVVSGMERIREAEKSNEKISVKDSAVPFGELLSETMKGCIDNPVDDQIFSSLCKHLGMWIYVIDACVDLKKDIKKKKYNPLKIGYESDDADYIISCRRDEILEFLISCKQSMQQLVELFSCGKNENLIHDLFEYLLPQEVASMLKE